MSDLVYSDGDVMLYRGDCCETLSQLPQSPRYLFADPVFNIGQTYDADFCDRKPEREYHDQLRRWLASHAWAMPPGAVMTWHVPDRIARVVIQSEWMLVQHDVDPLDWTIWHYRFGEYGSTKWVNSKAHDLHYVKRGAPHTFNADAVRVASDRAAVYSDKRIDQEYRDPKTGEKRKGGTRPPLDVFGIPSDGPFWGRVQGTNKERVKERPNQLPEKLIERLILAYTDPGDWVCDCFLGTGTTLVVARALGRRFIGGDISQAAIDAALTRLEGGAVRVDRKV